MTIAWVIGSGGLLGSALCRALRNNGAALFIPAERFSWGNALLLKAQLAGAVQSFAEQTRNFSQWQIYWAAGVGNMGSAADVLTPETDAFAHLLNLIEIQPELSTTHGTLTLASSAGAIYAGCMDEIINDDTHTLPTTPYAHEKLRQEGLLRAFALKNNTISALLARISTLYGPGSAIGKQQGLITHIARCLLQNKPIQIYVPLDTIRDYITADDAAAMLVVESRATSQRPGVYTRIVASEQPTTIAEIVSIYKRITRRNPRIVTSASKLSSVYSRCIQFRTKAISENARVHRTSLFLGIAQVMSAERSAFSKSKT